MVFRNRLVVASQRDKHNPQVGVRRHYLGMDLDQFLVFLNREFDLPALLRLMSLVE